MGEWPDRTLFKYYALILHQPLYLDMNQLRRRARRRSPHQAAKAAEAVRRKSMFDPLQTGAQIHIDLSRGVVEVVEDKPAVLEWISSGRIRVSFWLV